MGKVNHARNNATKAYLFCWLEPVLAQRKRAKEAISRLLVGCLGLVERSTEHRHVGDDPQDKNIPLLLARGHASTEKKRKRDGLAVVSPLCRVLG